jgi:putative cardiolipin synthase
MRCFAYIAVALLSVGCASLRTDAPRPVSHALAPVADTTSSRYIQSELHAHEGLSGFRLLSKADNALLSRIVLADHAQHSIDLQYYIFNNDATGRLLAQRLLTAADHGVRVRILVDDINSGRANTMLSALATHTNIEVRMFNPFRTRNPSIVSKTAQMLLEGRRLNRRMHNKSFIVDGWVAVVGGRNIGDEYFDASKDSSFRDLDVIAIGPVVAQAETSFDKYWNCDAAFPLMQLRVTRPARQRVQRERKDLAADAREFAQSDYAQAVLEDLPEGPTADRRGEWFWGNATFVADEPEKIETDHDVPALRMGPQVRQLFDAAQRELVLITPYFVPGQRGLAYFSGLRKKGVEVKVLTNSLASTDELAVYAWYAHYRRPLLEQGVHMYELRPIDGEQKAPTSGGKSSGVSLHAKAAVIDRRWVLVGSMNMDERSRLLNTEMGVIVDSPTLAQAVMDFFDAATGPQRSFAVTLQKGDGEGEHVVWRADNDGKTVTYHIAPGANPKKRVQVVLYRMLPIEQLL